MDESGTLPSAGFQRRWAVGASSPIADPLPELMPSLEARVRSAAAEPADTLPAQYGDADGLWVTVKRQNPFDVLLLNPASDPDSEALLVRSRVLWKFWSQKLMVARQGASRAAIREKYGDRLESYVENVQWAFEQLSTPEGVSFWRTKIARERAQTLWSRMHEIVEAALADGMLEPPEVEYLLSRATYAGYEHDEFARELREILHSRHFEPEVAPSGTTEASRLASVKWATPEVWERQRNEARRAAVEHFYVRIQRTGQFLGPLEAGVVDAWARRGDLSASDAICVVGAAAWQPLLHSRFGSLVAGAGPSCPRCGSPLSHTKGSSAAGWVLLVLGLFTLVVYVGIVLVIIGIVLLAQSGKTTWSCPRCGYAGQP